MTKAHSPYPRDKAPTATGNIRFILPVALRQALKEHPLSRDLYLTAVGYAPGASRFLPVPRLTDYLLCYCIGGNMKLSSTTEVWQVSSGDLVVIPPNMAFETEASEMAPCASYWVLYSGKLSDAYTKFIKASGLVVHLGLHPELIVKFEDLCNLRASNFTIDALVNGANQLKVLLTSISLTLAQKTNPKQDRFDLNLIRDFMMERLDKSLNLQELADFVKLSSYHFSRTFKKLTGQSPMHYFIQLRIQMACYLLDTTQQTIKQIAPAVGYPDTHHFSRVFRQVIGRTPTAYRKFN